MNERFTTLDQVVKDICEIGGDDYDHKSYGKVLKVCVNTLRGFNLYSSTPYVKTEEFEVLPNNTVLLPRNALDVVRVGKNDRCGEIEEIFYSKDLSMDAKNIEEHCECSGKVQVIETIETGTGETLCDYIVEGIVLSEEVCNYIIPNATLDGNWIEYIFAEKYENNLNDGDGNPSGWEYSYLPIIVFQTTNDYPFDNTPSDEELNLASTYSGIVTTLTGESLAQLLYDKWLAIPTINKSRLVLNGRSLTVYISNILDVANLIITRANAQYLPVNSEDFFEYRTVSTDLTVLKDNYDDLVNYDLQVYIIETHPSLSLFVNINGNYVDISSEIVDGVWQRLDSTDIITDYYFYNNDLEEIVLTGLVDSLCEEGNSKTFEVNINGEWEDETNNVSEEGVWELLNTTDIVTEWRYRDSEGEPSEPTLIEGICRVDLQRQEVSKWVDNNIECDTNGRCKSCGNFVPTYTTAWYGGWYSSAPIYSRQLAQNNLNLPNSGQAYYEQYTARPYPARWGFYNLDLAKGVMRLTHNFEHDEKVVIIYSTDMVEIEGAKVVAVEWFDMLLYRCKELIWNRNSVDGTRQRQLYEREYTRIKKIYNKTTHEEWRRAIMKVKYSGVKR